MRFPLLLSIIMLWPFVALPQRACDRYKLRIEHRPQCPEYHFEPCFRDDFEGRSLDLSKWEAQEGVNRDPYHTIEQQWYAADNVELKDGFLYLYAKKEPTTTRKYTIWMYDDMEDFSQPFTYSSAEIHSKKKYSYGKYEIRCKLPKGKGFFPAFWTFGGPEWNEIDVFEFWNEKGLNGKVRHKILSRKHKMNVHFDYDGDGNSNSCTSKYSGPDFSADFHVFTLIWTPYRLEWYVDGELKRSSNRYQKGGKSRLDCKDLKANKKYDVNRIFPIRPMTIIANLAIQSGHNGPDDTTPFPSALVIDYIAFEAMVDNKTGKLIEAQAATK